MTSFFIALGILLLLILANFFLTPKAKETKNAPEEKQVTVYRIGQAPRISVSAKIEKGGVIKITAQTPGIVSVINVINGQEVQKGTILVSLASNYQGGNALSVSRELAAEQYKNAKDTNDTQKDIIRKNRMLADQQKDNNDALRDLTNTSIDETQSLVHLNSDILNNIKSNILQLQATNVGGSNNQAIAGAQQLQAQLQGGNNQLQQSLRSAQYQVNPANPPTQISNLMHDIAIDQLNIQEKALSLSLEVGKLQLVLAQITEATMYPAAPFDGTVEEVHVHEGQSVAPGTLLVTISGNDKNATIVAKLPINISGNISKLEESTLHFGTRTYGSLPEYISSEATDGMLNTVIFPLPDSEYEYVADGQYVPVDIPVGYPDTGKATPFVPIDSVYQTQDGAFIYVVRNGKAESRVVTLGNVLGSFVAVTKGLVSGDQVILDRTVVVGDRVKIGNI